MSTTARTSSTASSCLLCCCRPNSCQCHHNNKKPGSPYSHLIGTNEPSLAPQFKWLENTSKLIAGVMDTGDNCSTGVINTVDLFIASIYSTDYKWISGTRCYRWCCWHRWKIDQWWQRHKRTLVSLTPVNSLLPVIDTIVKHKVANISTNFCKNLKLPM